MFKLYQGESLKLDLTNPDASSGTNQSWTEYDRVIVLIKNGQTEIIFEYPVDDNSENLDLSVDEKTLTLNINSELSKDFVGTVIIEVAIVDAGEKVSIAQEKLCMAIRTQIKEVI